MQHGNLSTCNECHNWKQDGFLVCVEEVDVVGVLACEFGVSVWLVDVEFDVCVGVF